MSSSWEFVNQHKILFFASLASICGISLLLSSTDIGKTAAGILYPTGESPSVDETVTIKKAINPVHVSKATSQPNIVFILADDLAYQNIGGGNPDYEGAKDLAGLTPVLTDMAKNGLIMTNYYAMETCTPSRASLLTGRYPIKIGMQYGVVEMSKGWGLPLGEQTLAEVLSHAGYKTHMVGKWHLGHHSPRYLPTARGFDTFTGFVDSENYYFSKKSPTNQVFTDFMTSNKDCYHTYDGPSLHNYSTHLYKDLAIRIIEEHDQSDPLFLYLAFNAVHVPFNDIPDEFPKGYRETPDTWVSSESAHIIDKQVSGVHRKLYASTLNILDQSVGHIKNALEDVGMLGNTYIIFASDNGGCYLGGGRNAPLRGNKATMLEGGTKVDAFIFSPLFKDNFAGMKYNGLMHVSDWFPTILNMVGVDFQERKGYELDGVSQLDGWQGEKKRPRIYMLYNSYTNVANVEFDMWTNAPFAIRNEQYKLVHYFDSDTYAGYQQVEETLEDDQLWTSKTKECKSKTSFSGDFTYALYDIVNDPYETTNLYDSTDEEIVTAKNELYELMQAYNDGAALDVVDMMEDSMISKRKWQAAGDYVVPWTDVDTKLGKQLDASGATYPSFCGSSSEFLTQ